MHRHQVWKPPGSEDHPPSCHRKYWFPLKASRFHHENCNLPWDIDGVPPGWRKDSQRNLSHSFFRLFRRSECFALIVGELILGYTTVVVYEYPCLMLPCSSSTYYPPEMLSCYFIMEEAVPRAAVRPYVQQPKPQQQHTLCPEHEKDKLGPHEDRLSFLGLCHMLFEAVRCLPLVRAINMRTHKQVRVWTLHTYKRSMEGSGRRIPNESKLESFCNTYLTV